MIAPETVYPSHPEFLVVVFDLREPGGPAELHRQRATLQSYADIEALDENHFVLIVRPSWASEAA
jgi:hypothetical protein